jgi:hypothetical protein
MARGMAVSIAALYGSFGNGGCWNRHADRVPANVGVGAQFVD